jgi:hypothetical protein
VRVSARLNGPRGIAGRQDDGRNAVHDALVVSCRSVRISNGQRVRVQDDVDDIAATESLGIEDREPGQVADRTCS